MGLSIIGFDLFNNIGPNSLVLSPKDLWFYFWLKYISILSVYYKHSKRAIQSGTESPLYPLKLSLLIKEFRPLDQISAFRFLDQRLSLQRSGEDPVSFNPKFR